MKKRTILLLATALFLPLTASAQHSSKAAETKQLDPTVSKKATLISGQISLDGKTLVTDKNEIWAITNPDVLAGHKGEQVRVKCQVFAAKSEIQVFSFEPGSRDVRIASNRTDSAFRR
ncbi:MAG TPA: hypothetical protein VEI73_15860 [Candidatus Acidoferrum sp.]|nr:hypothetical protein [Candidatus Acidoferrum sp.]